MQLAPHLRVAMVLTVAALITGGLPALTSTADSSPATPRATTPHRVAIAAKAPTLAQTRIHGRKVTRKVLRPTRLQRLSGRSWTTLQRLPTKRSGWVTYHVTTPPVTTRYRVHAPAKKVQLRRTVRGHVVRRTVVLPAWTSPVRTVTVTARPSTTPWVTGYYLGYYWDVGDMLAPEDVDMSAITHLMFGRTAPGGGDWKGEPGQPDIYPGYPYEVGELIPAAGSAHRPGTAPDGSGRSVERYLVDRAHRAGKKALVMIGGMGDGPAFIRSSADGVRKKFAKSIVDYLVERDYDGLDLDWEDCLKGESGCGEGAGEEPVSADEVHRRLMALIVDIRAEAASRTRYAHQPVLITFPGYTLTPGDPDDMVGPRAVTWRADIAKAVDQYNLMSYGIGTTWNGAGWDSWFSSALKGAGGAHPRDIASSIDA